MQKKYTVLVQLVKNNGHGQSAWTLDIYKHNVVFLLWFYCLGLYCVQIIWFGFFQPNWSNQTLKHDSEFSENKFSHAFHTQEGYVSPYRDK